MTAAVAGPALNVSEAAFQSAIVDLALLYRCRVAHFRPAMVRPGRWATAMTGHPGWPDLAIARDGWFIAAEVKRHNGRLSPDQRLWLAALGGFGRCWRPGDWPDIVRELRDGPAVVGLSGTNEEER